MVNQKVIRGRDSVNRIPELMGKLNIRRPLIIGGKTLTERLKRIDALKNAPVFSGYHPNPDLSDCSVGAEMFCAERCDGLIGIGGGSAMDTAKGIKAFLCALDMDHVIARDLAGTEKIPHIAIPGTAGTGAEATSVAVTYVDGEKVSIDHSGLIPEGIVLDSALLDSLPDYHKKSAALDALAQGIESWWSVSATEDSRVHAYLAILGVLDNIRGFLSNDPRAADEMLDASYQSGKAIRLTRTTAAHAMSYQLTKRFGVAHGHACMMTLPVLWEHMIGKEETGPELKKLSSAMRLGDPYMGPKLLRGLMYELGMESPPMPDEKELDALADSVNTERLGNHPEKLTRDDLKGIYRQAFLPLCEAEKQACLDIWNYYGR